jgi:cytoskeletal protein RodZ
MTTGTFGESLKRERELRGVTLEEISAATRIATRFLKAIEAEQWDQLPGGVFNRGFVRAMARFLGLDEENIVAEYTLAVGDRPSVPVWTGSPPVVTSHQPWLAWSAAVIVILGLVAGGWFGTRRLLAWRAARKAAAVTTAAAVPSSATGGGPLSSAPDPSAPPSAAPAAGAANPIAITPAAATGSTATASASSPSTDQMELKIEVAKRTKVTVVTDQDMVFDGTMKTGENHFFSASDHIQVSAKDAGAVRLVLNGKSLAPLGPSGKSGKVTLTRDALKGSTGGAN